MWLHEVDNPHLELVKYSDMHCMEEVVLYEVTRTMENLSKHIDFSVNLAGRAISIGCLGVAIVECSISVVMPPGLLLVRRDIISKFVLWTIPPHTDMPLEMM